MNAADRCEALARVLHDQPVPDRTEAIISLLAMTALDIVQTSPEDQAARLAAIAKVCG